MAAEQGPTGQSPAPSGPTDLDAGGSTGTEGISDAGTTDSSGAADTGTTDPDTGTTGGESDETDGSEDGKSEWFALVIAALAALCAGFVYLFYDRWRQSYETMALSVLKATNRFPATVFNPVEDEQFRREGVGPAAASKQPVVTGPAAAVVGEPTTYKAEIDGGSADACTWQVEPAGAASVQPASGASVTVVAQKEGPFTLSVKGEEGEPTLVHVAAVPKPSGEGGVPLLGAGFAGTIAVIVAVAIAGGLTALGTLGADAFIAFLGPVLGYFFARATSTSGEGKEAGGQ